MPAPYTRNDLLAMKQRGEKIAVLTAYDASFARLMEKCGVDVVLVGDSLGMVVQGHDTTRPVSVEEMIYHSRIVKRGLQHTLLVTDMSFQSYATAELALQNARRLIEEGGADVVKLEGGGNVLPMIKQLVTHGIRVCGHLGLLPQSVVRPEDFKVQGREERAAQQILADAVALQEAGVDMIVLECIPAQLAKQVSESLSIPTIGIGAGIDCDGQVLVVYDMLGITPGKRPRFVNDFLAEVNSSEHAVEEAISSYVHAVKQGVFPTAEQSYQ